MYQVTEEKGGRDDSDSNGIGQYLQHYEENDFFTFQKVTQNMLWSDMPI